MRTFLEVLNHPVDAFRTGSKTVSWGLVTITILLNTVFEPMLRFFCSDNAHDIDIVNNKLVSKCEDFITSDKEIIVAYDILNSEKRANNIRIARAIY